MQRALTPAERVIVAADFKPTAGEGRDGIRSRVLTLSDELAETGVILKMNSALRACGYGLIDEVQSRGLRVFADLKLNDIGETLSIDGALLREARPALLTVMCATGLTAMLALKAELPDTEVLGVTVLTSLTDKDADALYGCDIETAVMRFAHIAAKAGIDGLICSPRQAEKLRAEFGPLFSLNTPAVRPWWSVVPGDDQNPLEIMTPAKAMLVGADRIVVGRPITLAKSRRDAVLRTIEEIAQATT